MFARVCVCVPVCLYRDMFTSVNTKTKIVICISKHRTQSPKVRTNIECIYAINKEVRARTQEEGWGWRGVQPHFAIQQSRSRVCICVSVLLAYSASSQCSEAHRQACAMPYLQLHQLAQLPSTSGRYVPDYNETTLRNVCRLD